MTEKGTSYVITGTRMKDKRLYPNTVIFQTTDGKGVTYYNARVLEQIRDEILEEQSCWREDADAEWHECRRILRIIDKYRKGEQE